MDEARTHAFVGVLLALVSGRPHVRNAVFFSSHFYSSATSTHVFSHPHCDSVTCGLSPPTILSNTEEFILQPGSDFNISCTGERAVRWAANPMPGNTVVTQENFKSTLTIFQASVENVGDYTCVYENPEGEPDSEEDPGIYVFVPGEYVFYF